MVNNWPHSLLTDVWAPALSSSASRPRVFFPLTAEAAAGREMTSSWSSCSREGLSGWEPKLSGLVSWRASLAQSSDHGSGLTGSAWPFVPSPWCVHGRCLGSWCLQEELSLPGVISRNSGNMRSVRGGACYQGFGSWPAAASSQPAVPTEGAPRACFLK